MVILTQAAGSNPVFVLVLYVVIIAVFFYFISRPQKKEQKRLQAMLSSLEIGDTVLTTSGFYGIIIDIADDTVIVEFGNNKNCRIPMQKEAIKQTEKPGGAEAEPEKAKKSDSDKEKGK